MRPRPRRRRDRPSATRPRSRRRLGSSALGSWSNPGLPAPLIALGRLPQSRRSGAIRRNVHLAKMIERPSGLGAQTTPEFEEQHKRWESASEKGKPRKGPGSGAVDRTLSDVPLKTIYGPEDTAHLDLARDLA